MKDNEIGLLRGGQVNYLIDRKMNIICKKYHLRRVDIEVLFYLKNNPERNTASDIQKSLHINKGYVSQIVNGLCEKGYLTSEEDRQDRRYMHYSVTEKTHEITDTHQQFWESIGAQIFQGISDEDREVFDRVIDILFKNIDAMLDEQRDAVI